MERGKYYMGGKVEGLQLPTRVFPCATPAGAPRPPPLPPLRWACSPPRPCPPGLLLCCSMHAALARPSACPRHMFAPALVTLPPADVRATLPEGSDVLAFQCRNPIHRAHYELFIRALDAPNVGSDAVCLVHPTCGPTQVRLHGGGVVWPMYFGTSVCSIRGWSRPATSALRPPSVCSQPSQSGTCACPSCSPQDDDISGIVRYRTYEVLKEETNNPRLR